MYRFHALVASSALTSVALFFAAPAAAQAPPAAPTMTDLSTEVGIASYRTTSALDISGDGSVVLLDTSGVRDLYDLATGTRTNFAVGTGYNSVNPLKTSFNGSTTVGSAYTTAGRNVGAYWNGGNLSNTIELNPLLSNTLANTLATGVDDSGSVIVGFATFTPQAEKRAFRWTATGGILELGTLGYGSDAWGVSGDGNVVVGSSTPGGTNLTTAVFWTFSASGGPVLQNMGLNTGQTRSVARAADYTGNTIVGSSWNPNTGKTSAFLWKSGATTTLPSLGGTYTDAIDISADGTRVVGESYLVSGNPRAYMFDTTTGQMTDLGTLGGYASRATAISAAGDIIVGNSLNAQRRYRAFIYRITPTGGGGGMLDLVNTQTAIGSSALAQAALVGGIGANLRFSLSRELEVRAAAPSETAFSSKGTGMRAPVAIRIEGALNGNGSGQQSPGAAVSAAIGIGTNMVAGAFVQTSDTPSQAGIITMRGTQTGYGAYLRARPGGNTGLTWKLGLAGSSGTMDIVRDATLANTEAGRGSAAVTTTTGNFEIGYGMKLGKAGVTPFLRVVTSTTTRAGYTEQANISFPVTYDPYMQSATTAAVGVNGTMAFGPRNIVRFGAGLETDLGRSNAPVTGTSAIPGMTTFSVPAPTVVNPTRAFASIGFGHMFANNSQIRIDASIQQNAYSTAADYGVSMGYEVRF